MNCWNSTILPLGRGIGPPPTTHAGSPKPGNPSAPLILMVLHANLAHWTKASSTRTFFAAFTLSMVRRQTPYIKTIIHSAMTPQA